MFLLNHDLQTLREKLLKFCREKQKNSRNVNCNSGRHMSLASGILSHWQHQLLLLFLCFYLRKNYILQGYRRIHINITVGICTLIY